MCQGVPLVKGQFRALIVGYFPFFEKYPHSDTCVCIGCGYDKVGRRYQNNQGLTKHIQYGLVKKNKKTIFGLNSQVQYLNIPWAMSNSDEYIKANDKINECYRKMLMIGKCNEVFRPSNDKVPDLLLEKTSNEFKSAKKNIQRHFKRFLKSGAAKLNIIIPTELVPNPKNYFDKCNLKTPISPPMSCLLT